MNRLNPADFIGPYLFVFVLLGIYFFIANKYLNYSIRRITAIVGCYAIFAPYFFLSLYSILALASVPAAIFDHGWPRYKTTAIYMATKDEWNTGDQISNGAKAIQLAIVFLLGGTWIFLTSKIKNFSERRKLFPLNALAEMYKTARNDKR